MEKFIPSDTFAGSKRGYVFRNGDSGLGYYLDAYELRKMRQETEQEEGRESSEEQEQPEVPVEDELKEDEGAYHYHLPGQEEEDEEEEEEEEDGKSLTKHQKKLKELRKRMKKCRKENHKAIGEEQKKKQDTRTESQIRKEEHESRKTQKLEELKLKGMGPDKAYMLQTAQRVEQQQSKLKKKAKNKAFGWEVFNQDTLYNAYKKRLKKVPYSQEEYDVQKAKEGPVLDANAMGIDSLNYADQPLSRLQMDRMVTELEEHAEKRKSFKRRREFNEDADISYINEGNRRFNEKIGRDFNKYTAEVRQNLERGTAL